MLPKRESYISFNSIFVFSDCFIEPTAIGDAAGIDQFKIIEIGRDIERQAVIGDPVRDGNPDRRDFAIVDPDAGQPGFNPASIL